MSADSVHLKYQQISPNLDNSALEILSYMQSAIYMKNGEMSTLHNFAMSYPESRLLHSMSSLNVDEITDIIWCLGTLRKSFANIRRSEPSENQILVASEAIRLVHEKSSLPDAQFLSRSAAKLAWGIAKMGVSWEELCEAGVERQFSSLLLPAVAGMNSRGVSNLLYALALLQPPLAGGHRSSKLSQALLRVVLQQLQAVAASRSFRGQALSNSLWALGRLGLQWSR